MKNIRLITEISRRPQKNRGLESELTQVRKAQDMS